MSVSVALSFDIYPSAPNPTLIREGVRGIVDKHATAGKWLLGHLLLLQLPNAGTFNALSAALRSFHDRPEVGPCFDFVAVGWVDGTPDVFFAARPRPAGAAAADAEYPSLVRAKDLDVDSGFNHLEVALGFRTTAGSEVGAAPATVIYIGGAPADGGGARGDDRSSPRGSRRKRRGRTPR